MAEDGQILDEGSDQSEGQPDLVTLTVDIVSAYVSNNSVPPTEMAALLSSVHAAVAGLGSPPAVVELSPAKPTPSQIRKSITPGALISFIDGKPYKTLKRHLTGNGLTIEEYRQRFGLPRDYPSVAASYSEQRSTHAKNSGLGQLRRKAAPKTAEVAQTVSEASGRKEAVEPAEQPSKTRKSRKPTSAEAVE